MDAHDAFSKRVKMAAMPEPPGCCAALRAEADSLVEEWWRHTEAEIPAHRPSRPVPMPAPSTSEGPPFVAPLGWQAVANFDARPYGRDYIGLRRGDAVVMLDPPAGEAGDVHWTYGKVGDSQGWLPTAYIVQRSGEASTPSEEPMASASNPVGPARDVPLAQAIGDFDACQYGEEYIELSRGDVVELMEAPGGEVADVQWSYGRVGTLQGWFPTTYIVRRSQGRSVITNAPEDISQNGQGATAGMAEGSEVSETSLPTQVASAVALQLIPWRAIQRFESEAYGEGYIDLHVGDEIVPLPTPPGEDDTQ